MNRALGLTVVAIATVGLIAGGISSAGGGIKTIKVKTTQPGKDLQFGKGRVHGQIEPRRGTKQARFRCRGDRRIILKGPRPIKGEAAASGRLIKLGTDKTDPIGRWAIKARKNTQFGEGTYRIKIKSKKINAKLKNQKIKCKGSGKRVRR